MQAPSWPAVGDPALMAARIIESTVTHAYRFIHDALTERLAEIEAQSDSSARTDALPS
ncbi:hypothetical protein [Amycolatopsis sp. MEPSY49]|uniref:hypothetical protein n=1 Tax=Amycolatopsis sp. MEPSY49 TaxID=3151600 RepID=UPI003EF5ED08